MLTVGWIRRTKGLSRYDALAALGLLAWAVAAAFPHLPLLQRLWPTCHFRSFTGLPCGTCGFTRAFVHGARFEVGEAFASSPLGALTFFVLVVLSFWIAATWLAPRLPLPRPHFHPLIVRFAPLALFLANWGWLLWQVGAAGAAA